MCLTTSTTKSHLKRKWAYGPDVTCLCPQGAGQAARPPDRSLCSWSGAPTGLCLRPGLGPGAQASPACSRGPCAVRGPEAHTRENQTKPGQHKVLHTLTMTSAQRTGHPSPVWKTRKCGEGHQEDGAAGSIHESDLGAKRLNARPRPHLSMLGTHTAFPFPTQKPPEGTAKTEMW